jgi:hypothetical protein
MIKTQDTDGHDLDQRFVLCLPRSANLLETSRASENYHGRLRQIILKGRVDDTDQEALLHSKGKIHTF